MNIRKLGASLLVGGVVAAGAATLTTTEAEAATKGIQMVCKQSPNITGDITSTFEVSFDAPTEVEQPNGFSVENIVVPFANNQGFDLDIGPGTVDITNDRAVPDFAQRSFPQVSVNNGSSTTFGPFDVDYGGTSAGPVKVSVERVQFDVALKGGNKLTTVTCTPTGSAVLTTIQVVLPPPPGAPNANPDSAEVKPGESVVIDVLANDANPAIEDTPRADLGAVTLPEIMNAPGEGTAEVNDDGTVTYTANADTTASGDSFDYRICSAFEQPEFAGRMGKAFAAGDQQPCDTTTVSIGITQAQATTAPTTAAPTTAPAGSVSETTDELPVTGSSSGPLGVLGFAAAIVGLGLLALSRRARTA